MANSVITEREVEKAKKLAARASGVTRAQLAAALGGGAGVVRAAKILERAGLSGRRAGNMGRQSRTLVYKA